MGKGWPEERFGGIVPQGLNDRSQAIYCLEQCRREETVTLGLSDGSQAIYCLEQVQSRIRPVGHGLIQTQVD
jgi:hypothetical protein